MVIKKAYHFGKLPVEIYWYIHISTTYREVTDDDGVCECLFSFVMQRKDAEIILPKKFVDACWQSQNFTVFTKMERR